MRWFSFLSSWKRAEGLSFYNTLSKEQEVFSLPSTASTVRMYNCGPTVYGPQHIGNLSAAVFADTLRRVLEHNDYKVKQVINITDFGHLVSDSDDGEDKMAKGLRAAGKEFTMENMRELATGFMEQYLDDVAALNVVTEKITFPRASDHIPAQIAMIETLVEKGYAYETSDGVYFEVSRFPRYGALGGIDLEHQKEGARVAINGEKHGPNDFALWKKNESLGWDSPWGKGFPGWHIECSAMIHSLLGKQIDIHTGGIEHIAIHHNNEIAQSEAATGKHPFSRFWMHRAHIRMNDAKMAKSDGNVAYLSDVLEKGYHPLALRYWFLTSHYRSPANFTWDALDAAQKAFLRLRRFVDTTGDAAEVPAGIATRIDERLNDDLDTPGTLALLWELSKEAQWTPAQIKAAISYADTVLGLGFEHDDAMAKKLYEKDLGVEVAADDAPADIKALLEAREAARAAKDWAKADALRAELAEKGYKIEDGAGGARVVKMG
jgi:cysteinyl-tRNA synthetase